MNPALQPTTHKSNPVNAASLLKSLSIAFLVGVIGLAYVFLKNQQFVLAEEIRQTERKIRHVQSRNDVLLARVTELSSRPTLQRRVAEGFIAVVPIPVDKIARLTPPAIAPESGILRTAFNEETLR
jgi:hypothetical protein